jgi:diacylglycerol kinase (ATP)
LNITVIIRPREGDERITELVTAVRELRREGHRVLMRTTAEPGDATRFARLATRRQADLIVSAGGDGTLNEVVNGIARCRHRPKLAVVPVGTANDFALGVGIPENVTEALHLAVHGQAAQVDIARVNRRFFMNVSTGGFGAQATEDADPDMKRRLGAVAYLISGFKHFVEFNPASAQFVTDDGVLHDGEFVVFAVGNARQTGGGNELTPRANLSDGKLDVVIVPALSRMDFLALLPDLRAGTHLSSPDVKYVQTRRLHIQAPGEISVNVDGEPIPGTHFDYRVHDRPITVMLPESDNDRA